MSKVVLLADGAAQTKNRMLLCLPVSFWAGLGYVYYSKGNYFWLCACLLFFAAAPYQYKYVIRWCIVHLRLCHRFERYAYRRIGINSWSREKRFAIRYCWIRNLTLTFAIYGTLPWSFTCIMLNCPATLILLILQKVHRYATHVFKWCCHCWNEI